MTNTRTIEQPAGDSTAAEPERRRFTVDEYYRMAETGILLPGERVELLEGEIFCMSPIGSPHMRCVIYLTRWFDRRVGDRALVSVQNPVRIVPRSEPQPDVVLLRFREDLYGGALPVPADVLLLIEVSDSSLAYDRGRKLPLYAAAGVPEVWIVDIEGKRVLVFRALGENGYGETITAGNGDSLSPASLPDLQMPVAELLPG